MSKSRFYLMMALIGGVFAGKLLSGSGDWEWNVPELLSVVFFGLWLLGSTVMLIIVILTKTKTMTINQDGVTVNRPIDTKSLRWNQILDYGVDFSNKSRSAVYYERFSDILLDEGDKGKERSGKTTVRIDLEEVLMDRYVSPIMDYCADHTQFTPFPVHPYNRLRFQSSGWEAYKAAKEPSRNSQERCNRFKRGTDSSLRSESRREQSGGGSACGLTRRTAPFCKVEAQFSGIWIRFWGSDPNRPFRASSIF